MMDSIASTGRGGQPSRNSRVGRRVIGLRTYTATITLPVIARQAPIGTDRAGESAGAGIAEQWQGNGGCR